MVMRCRASLDGHELDAIDENIYILDISENPAYSTSSVARPGLYGSHFTTQKRTGMEIKISFQVREYDVAKRQYIADRIFEWCGGKVLKTSTRPGKQINVVCTGFPNITSALKWTDTLSVSLTAYECPYWSDEYETEITEQNKRNFSKSLFIPGNTYTEMNAALKNVSSSSTIYNMQFEVGDSKFVFEHLGLAKGETFHISHKDGYIEMYITSADGAEKRSVYDKRTVDSTDELILRPGENAITASAQWNCDWRISARGKWS